MALIETRVPKDSPAAAGRVDPEKCVCSANLNEKALIFFNFSFFEAGMRAV